MVAFNPLLSILLLSNAFFLGFCEETEPLHAETNCEELQSPPRIDPGQPLYLTPYIESGDIAKARALSKVGRLPNAPRIWSYSGLFTVNKQYNSNMFFWFFPALNKDTRAPVILWLEGGPGASDLFSIFVLHGPYIARKNLTLDARPHTWNKEFNMLYVDNPVGSGFSHTDDDAGYATDMDQVAENLYEFLQQFFKVFREYARNDFYVAGESYAGKYVPAIAYKIHLAGPPSQTKFKGIAIGNGFCEPESQMHYADFFYQLGIMDYKQAEIIRNTSAKIVELIRKGKFAEASSYLNNIVAEDPATANPNYLLEFSGYKYTLNALQTNSPNDLYDYPEYIQLPEFRKAIHVGNLTFLETDKAANFLSEDSMKSIRPKLVPIMNNYKVLIYNGQLDLTLPYTAMAKFLSQVEWKLADELKEAVQQIWKLNGTDEVAGYVHNVGNFYQVGVRLAGHLVPYDQPAFGLDLITRFVKGEPYA